MPIVAVSPCRRTHSCDLAYFKSDGTLLIHKFRQAGRCRSIRFSINGFGNNGSWKPASANFDSYRRVGFGECRFHVAEAYAGAERRTLGAARDFANQLTAFT